MDNWTPEHRKRAMKPITEELRNEAELSNTSKRALRASKNEGDPIERLRLVCFSKGTTGILGLGRLFRHMAVGRNRQMNLWEFLDCLREIGLVITAEEAMEMFDQFDTDGRGHINLNALLSAIRPPMSETRMKSFDMAFEKLDKNGDGTMTIDDLKHLYNVKVHPRYMSGEDTSEMILKTFLANFEEPGCTDGIVTKEEFLNYYSAISASIDDDCYFDLMMRKAFKL